MVLNKSFSSVEGAQNEAALNFATDIYLMGCQEEQVSSSQNFDRKMKTEGAFRNEVYNASMLSIKSNYLLTIDILTKKPKLKPYLE